MKSADGEEIEIGAESEYIQPYRKEEVLREHLDDGLALREIADIYNVGDNTIRRHIHDHGIEYTPRGIGQSQQLKRVHELHEMSGVAWPARKPGGEFKPAPSIDADLEPVADGGSDLAVAIEWCFGVYECPDCGHSFHTRKGQHDCMRGHVRELANQLADENDEILCV